MALAIYTGSTPENDNIIQQGAPISCSTASEVLTSFQQGAAPQSCGAVCIVPDLFLSQDNSLWCTDTGGVQNFYWLIVCDSTTYGWLWMNTATGIISQGSSSTWPAGSTGTVTYTDANGHSWTPGTMPSNCGTGVNLHNAVLSKGDNGTYWVDYGPQIGCFGWGSGYGGSTQIHTIKLEWQLGTTTVYVCGYATDDCGGHHAQGATKFINNPANTNEYQLFLRAQTTPSTSQQQIWPVGQIAVNRWDSHQAWIYTGGLSQNAGTIDQFSAIVADDSSSQPIDQHYYEDEIVGISAKTVNGSTNALTYRWGHTLNVAYEGNSPLTDPCGASVNFNTDMLYASSDDGNLIIWTSNWLGGGAFNTNPPVLGCISIDSRTDVFALAKR